MLCDWEFQFRLASHTEDSMHDRRKLAVLVKYPLLLIALGAISGCAQPAPPEPALRMPRAIVDLSPTITRDMPTRALGRALGEKISAGFGITPATSFEVHVEEESFYRSMSVYRIFNHVGPHYDPPNHMIKGRMAVDATPLDRFFGRARLFDFRSRPPGEPLLRSDFDGTGIEPGEIVIVFVGYEAPADPEALPAYPYLSGDAAEYLAGIPVKAFASDMPSLGSISRYSALIEEGKTGSEIIFSEHYAFASRDIPGIEGLVNLESLVGEEEIVFVGFPLKFEDGDGGPMRAAALVY
jgi:kynurenine formamidase